MAINKNKVMESAQKYVEKGQTDKAIKEYLRVVEEDAKDVRVWLKIGDLYAKKNDKSAATETYLKVAEFYSEQGFYLKAVAVYKQVLKLDPRLIAVNIKLAEVYRQLGLLSDATQQYELVAAFYHREGKTKEALSTIRELVELDPENVATRIKLAELYSKEQMTKEAIAEFGKAADHLRTNARTDDFIKVAERLVWHQPDNHAINRELAGLYLKRSDPRHALTKLQACFKADPRDVETLSLLAQAFLALDQKPKTVSVWKELARIHLENNQPQQANEVYRRILGVQPDDADAQAVVTGRRGPLGAGSAAAVAPSHLSQVSISVPAPGPPPASPASAQVRVATPVGSDPQGRVSTPGSGVPSAAPSSHKSPPPRVLAPPPSEKAAPPPRLATPIQPSPPAPLARPVATPVRVAPPPAVAPAGADDLMTFDMADEPEVTSAGAPEDEGELLLDSDSQGEYEMQVDDLSGSGDEMLLEAGLDPAEAHAEEIAKILTETDVYAKYNLHQKAIDHLNRIFELDPRNVEGREKLKDVYIAQGRVGEALSELGRLVEQVAPGNPAQAESYLREIMGADPARARALATRFNLRVDAPPQAPVRSRPTAAEPGALEGGKPPRRAKPDELGLLEGGKPPRRAKPDEPPQLIVRSAAPPRVAEPVSADSMDSPFDEVEIQTGTPVPVGVETSDILVSQPGTMDFELDDLAAPAAPPAHPAPDEGTLEMDVDSIPDLLEPELGSAAIELDEEPSSHAEPPPEATFDASLEELDPLGDTVLPEPEPAPEPADFALPPDHDFALDGGGDPALDDSLAQPAPEPPPPVEEADAAGTSIEDDLDEADFFVAQNLFSEARDILGDLLSRHPKHPLVLAKLQDLDAAEHASAPGEEPNETAPPPPVTVTAPAAPERLAPAAAFTASPSTAPHRKPAVIAKPLGEEDADTHYDLGLAYKEMGLHDEAIKEFLLVRDTPGRAVQCHLMIGLCHAERGKFSDAVTEFKNGLYVDGITDRESLALYFELGAAYEVLTDPKEALYYFEKVAKRDAKFRDVNRRIEGLKAGVKSRETPRPDDDSIDAALDLLGDPNDVSV